MSSYVFDETFPFDPGFGQSANSTRWRKMASLWQSDGVVPTGNSLMATGPVGGIVTIQPGAVYIHGLYAELKANQGITITGSGTGTIVAQANLLTNNEFIQLIYRDGVVDYGTTPATAYEQDGTIWEIPLWMVSGGTLTDLRTFINPGSDLVWWNHSDNAVAINSAATQQVPVVTARIPYSGWAWLQGTALLQFSDSTQAQQATCSLTYQYGVSGGEAYTSTNVISPQTSAGGTVPKPVYMPVTLTAWAQVKTPGRKSAGWLVTAGTGPTIYLSQMTVTLRLAGVPPQA